MKNAAKLCLLVAPMALSLHAQDARERTVTFTASKPLLGLPDAGAVPNVSCANDGSLFALTDTKSQSPQTNGIPELYKISADGSATHVLRSTPHEYPSLRQLDFFIADQVLVTLLEGTIPDDDPKITKPRETHYILSVSDHDGDNAKLLVLDLSFTPLKIAAFDSGDFLVLGWNPVNLQPVLALLKENGSVRRFLDFAPQKNAVQPETYSSVAEERDSEGVQSEMNGLKRAAFVPSGKEVLLTFPDQARPVHAFTEFGEDRIIPVSYPGGYVLSKAIVSGASYSLVLLLHQMPTEKKTETQPSQPAVEPKQAIYEFSALGSSSGTLIQKYVIVSTKPGDVFCAAKHKFTAMFLQPIPDSVSAATDASGKSDTTTEPPKRLVIASTYR